MARPRLAIGTFGDITTRTMPSGRIEARTRFRDWDGCSRIVQATGDTARAAVELNRREAVGSAAVQGGQ